jgi:hypothetical protein
MDARLRKLDAFGHSTIRMADMNRARLTEEPE